MYTVQLGLLRQIFKRVDGVSKNCKFDFRHSRQLKVHVLARMELTDRSPRQSGAAPSHLQVHQSLRILRRYFGPHSQIQAEAYVNTVVSTHVAVRES